MSYYKEAGSFYHAQESDDFCASAVAFSILSDQDVGFSLQGACQSVLFQAGRSVVPLWVVDPGGMKKILNQFKESFKGEFEILPTTKEQDATAQIVGQIVGGLGVAPATLIFGTQHWIAINGVIADANPLTGSYKLLKFWIFDPFSLNPPSRKHANPDACERIGIKEYFVFYPAGWRQMMSGFFVGGVNSYAVLGVQGVAAANSPGTISSASITIPINPQTHRVDAASVPQLWQAWLGIYGSWPPGSFAEGYLPGSEVSTVTRLRRIDIPIEWYILTILKDGQFIGTGIIDASSGWPISVVVHAPGSPWRPYVERLATELVDAELIWRPCAQSMTPHLPFVESVEVGSRIFERIDGRRFLELDAVFQGK